MLIAHTYTFFVPQQWKFLWELGCSIFRKVRVTLDLVEIWHKRFVFRSTRPEPCNHSITSLLVINCALPGIPHFEGYPLDANQEHSQEQGRRKLNFPRTLNKHSKLWFLKPMNTELFVYCRASSVFFLSSRPYVPRKLSRFTQRFYVRCIISIVLCTSKNSQYGTSQNIDFFQMGLIPFSLEKGWLPGPFPKTTFRSFIIPNTCLPLQCIGFLWWFASPLKWSPL